MKAIKIIMVVVTGLIALLAGYGFALPESAHIERSIAIKAKAETIFPLINNLREFNRWSPWSTLDPQMVTSYNGPQEGVGAQMSWSGNSAVGTGSQEIIESVPHQRVKSKLQFGSSGNASTALFTLTPDGEHTKVTWAYDTSMGYDIIGRYFGLMLDGWIGSEYERGLQSLAQLAESKPKETAIPATP